jgi:hypothetical protein
LTYETAGPGAFPGHCLIPSGITWLAGLMIEPLLAHDQGRSALAWLDWAFLPGLVWAAILALLPQLESRSPCRSKTRADAPVCRYCGREAAKQKQAVQAEWRVKV